MGTFNYHTNSFYRFAILSWTKCALVPLLLSAFSIGLLLHADALVRHFHRSQAKTGVLISGPRTDVGDNYFYFTLARHALERFASTGTRSGDPDGSDHRNINSISSSYAAALYTSYGIYRIAALLTSTSRDALLVTSILHTSLLALSFSVFMLALAQDRDRGRWPPVLVVSFIGLLLIDAFGVSFYYGRFYWANSLLTYSSNPTRLVNPNLFWAIGLAASSAVVRWLQTEKFEIYLGAVLLASLTGMFSISVGATLTLGLGLTTFFLIIVNRSVPWKLLAITLAGVAGLAWCYFQLHLYTASSQGQELKHGEFVGLVIKWQFLPLLALIPILWRILGKEREFILALLVSAILIGMFCDSFNLGSRLWVRGAVVYAWSVTVFVGFRMALSWLSSGKGGKWWWQLPSVALMGLFVLQAQQPDVDAWKGFIERDKWELLDWINKNLPINSIVASEDIDDAYFLPVYTHVKSLYTMYGLTNRSRDEELRRYFYCMRLFGKDKQALFTALNLKEEDRLKYLNHVMGDRPAAFPCKTDISDALIFLNLVAYYSYGSGMPNALTDAAQHEQLEIWLKKIAKEALELTYSVDFVIVETDTSPPTRFLSWPLVYKGNRYSIRMNPTDLAPT